MSPVATRSPERSSAAAPARFCPLYSGEGERLGTVELDREIFSVEAKVGLLHQVVTAQMAARRSGTSSTRTRAEVRGGGAKPYRQKGTGRARQGSTRAPHFSGGGVAFGPKPRSYVQRTPKKMVQLGLRAALSDRARLGRVIVIESWTFPAPKTKTARLLLEKAEITGRVLVVLGGDSIVAERSFANLANVDLVESSQLTAYDVLCADWLVFTAATLPGGVGVVASQPGASEDDGSAGLPGREEVPSGEALSSEAPSPGTEDGKSSEGDTGAQL
jgi:large subunit ribosomal protein L4